jgi:diaminohydroxyphosphoribosylaminopyrimidine deaminase/5-amino-6-(5-phosphoribosylamino)uracil reductase
VEEGVPNTHGPDAFHLPDAVTAADPETALSALYEAGARTVLLHGGTDLANPFADRQLVDELKLYVATKSASAQEDIGISTMSGFRIDAVRRLSHGVLIETARS